MVRHTEYVKHMPMGALEFGHWSHRAQSMVERMSQGTNDDWLWSAFRVDRYLMSRAILVGGGVIGRLSIVHVADQTFDGIPFVQIWIGKKHRRFGYGSVAIGGAEWWWHNQWYMLYGRLATLPLHAEVWGPNVRSSRMFTRRGWTIEYQQQRHYRPEHECVLGPLVGWMVLRQPVRE